MNSAEIFRYICNGVFATLVHYSALSTGIELLELPASVSNFLGSAFGITVSYLGSRYWVFDKSQAPMATQAVKFISLYTAIALMNGLILLLWTDIFGYSYHVGFVIATFVQVLASYFGNKHLVFK